VRTSNQTIRSTTILLVLCFGLLVFNAVLDYVPAAYSQNQDSSFQAEVSAIDNMPAQKAKVGDIEIAYKRLGENNNDEPIVLIA
jgi:hypothetical protein